MWAWLNDVGGASYICRACSMDVWRMLVVSMAVCQLVGIVHFDQVLYGVFTKRKKNTQTFFTDGDSLSLLSD